MHRASSLLLFALSLALEPAAAWAAGAPPLPALPAGAEAAARLIDRPTLEAPIRFLADDLLEGRGPATRGDELTRLYLAESLQLLGLEPGAADGSWQQRVPVVSVTAQAPEKWHFDAAGKGVDLAWSQDYIAGSGVQAAESGFANAEVVFVGYGIQAPEYGWDDFKGQDLSGKVLLMLNNDPDWDANLFEGGRRLYYGRWTYKYESAARQHAAAAIILHTTPSAGYPWQVVQSSWTGPQFELPAAGEPRVQVKAWATEESVRRLLSAAGKNLDSLLTAARSKDFHPVPLGLRTSLQLTNEVRQQETGNVLGLLRGSDPKLSREVVVLSAHHDHFGKAPGPEGKDTIFNGAVDNASGVAMVMAMAKAAAALPTRPKRSLLFAFVAAEEQGLLGSKYLAANPPIPPGRMAANINLDSANIWGATRDVTSIGLGKNSLDDLARAFATAQGRVLLGDQFPDKGHFYRSDQLNFARIGVPALYLKGGTDFVDHPGDWGKQQVEGWTEVHYHQPSDQYSPSWNFDGMIQDTRLAFFVALAAAEADTPPTWKPGDEFEATRKAALAAAGP
ncbi:MAG: M28 family peptidase [Thermoanaerobaculia bacterium]